MLLGVSLYDVVISEVRVSLEGDPHEFAMYRVKSQEHSRYFEEQSQHRSDLFRRVDERRALIAEIEERVDALQNLRDELEDAVDEATAGVL